MNSLRTFLWRCREFFKKERFDADMAEEIRLHLERTTEQNIVAGMSPDEARYAAQRKFGNVGVVEQTVREQRGWVWLEQLLQDLRYAARSLRKAPGFSSVVVLTLALGIGASSAIFSIVNAVILRPLPFPAAEQLGAVRVVLPSYAQTYPTLPVSARFYQEWRNCPAFSHLALIDRNQGTLTGVEEPVRITIARCSGNLFATLGIVPALGRSFASDEDGTSNYPFAILSDRAWRNRFSADPAILGRAVTLDQRRLTVIGVLPADFRLPESRQFLTGKTAGGEPEIFVVKEIDVGELNDISGRFNYEVIGRLKAGNSSTTATAQLDVVAARLAKLSGEAGFEARSYVGPLHESIVGPARRGLFLLFGAIISVLLIACLNLSMLTLARAERHSHERAVRSALGATRARLLRQSFGESFLLSLVGSAFGCLFAVGGLNVLLQLAPADLPRLDEVRLDPLVLCFAMVATLFTAAVTGLIPAWRAARADASGAFRGSASRGSTSGIGTRRLRYLLIAIEAGVSTLLLVIAALLATSFSRLGHVNSDIRTPDAISTELTIPYAKYRSDQARIDYHQRLLAEIASTPGVTTAAIATALPLQGETWIDTVWIQGDIRPKTERPTVNMRFISADFFGVLGIPILAGRTFRDSDRQGKTAIVSTQLATRLWPGQDPIGRKIMSRGDEEFEVIGVAGDVRASADQRPVPVIYRPYWVYPPANVLLVAKISGSLAAVSPTLRAAIHRVDGDVPIGLFRTMNDLFQSSVNQRRFQLRLVLAFALSAIALAGLGIYGVVSHSVAQRTRELGIRLAFGAKPAALRLLVLRQGITPVAWGLLGGIVCSLAGGRLLSSMLFETDAGDPLTIAAVVVLLGLVAVIACWLPGRRATKIEPMIALRAE